VKCLACQAASRDALDLIDAQADSAADGGGGRVEQLVRGMDPDRMWRVLIYLTGHAAALAFAYSDAARLPVADVLTVLREETAAVMREGGIGGC
jgi:hypothetical protein